MNGSGDWRSLRELAVGKTKKGERGDDFFPGAIDDVRIYNETLTAAQVAFIAR